MPKHSRRTCHLKQGLQEYVQAAIAKLCGAAIVKCASLHSTKLLWKSPYWCMRQYLQPSSLSGSTRPLAPPSGSGLASHSCPSLPCFYSSFGRGHASYFTVCFAAIVAVRSLRLSKTSLRFATICTSPACAFLENVQTLSICRLCLWCTDLCHLLFSAHSF
jgi:hypothetical protein